MIMVFHEGGNYRCYYMYCELNSLGKHLDVRQLSCLRVLEFI